MKARRNNLSHVELPNVQNKSRAMSRPENGRGRDHNHSGNVNRPIVLPVSQSKLERSQHTISAPSIRARRTRISSKRG